MSTFQFHNVASGNAQVGAQIGMNTGTLSVGPAAVDGRVEAELGRLLAALHEARRRGEVDAEIVAEAEHEVGMTRSALAERETGRAMRALRRLGSTLDGVAGLGALAGAVTAAVEALTS